MSVSNYISDNLIYIKYNARLNLDMHLCHSMQLSYAWLISYIYLHKKFNINAWKAITAQNPRSRGRPLDYCASNYLILW
jgi:hypothetical protein